MVLPLFASMEKLDTRLLEAGSDLYASRFDLIRRIIRAAHHARHHRRLHPGVRAEPRCVHRTGSAGRGQEADARFADPVFSFATARNWPFGAAVAMVLLALVVLLLVVQARSAVRQERLAQESPSK